MISYKINCVFAVVLFLLTITYRNDLDHSLVRDIEQAKLFLGIWNWIMLVSLLLFSVQSLVFAFRYRGIVTTFCPEVAVFGIPDNYQGLSVPLDTNYHLFAKIRILAE
jgi:hypothetical protein